MITARSGNSVVNPVYLDIARGIEIYGYIIKVKASVL